MSHSFQHFGIIGSGAWGTALAQTLIRAGRNVTLWAHDPKVADVINQKHENTIHLPGITLDAGLKASTNLKNLSGCDVWMIATPAQHVRTIAKQLHALKSDKKPPVILTAKGIEQKTSALLSDVIAEELPQHLIAILSGPSFAAEVAQLQPTALTFACADKTLGQQLVYAMSTPAFRLYLTDDIVGSQIGGAVKNVLAIACGIIEGRKMGENARAALITRGLAEIIRLGTAKGGRAETLMGLSGLGDVMLTCSSVQSRNMSLGLALGQGKTLESVLASRTSVTEGITTAAATLELAKKHGVEMPITAAVNAVLAHKADIDGTIASLLARPLKTER